MEIQNEMREWLRKESELLGCMVTGIVVTLPCYRHDFSVQWRESSQFLIGFGANHSNGTRNYHINNAVDLNLLTKALEGPGKCWKVIDQRLNHFKDSSLDQVGLLIQKHSLKHRRLAENPDKKCQCTENRTCDACYSTGQQLRPILLLD